jgi:undecaprenyl-diphosphatase
MDLLKSALLGLIEGITEFLPVSSTAHLLLVERLIGFKDTAGIFTVVIQFGAIIAALAFFWNEIMSLVRGLLRKDKDSISFLWKIIIGILPAGLVGLIVEATIGIPHSLVLVGVALIVGGVVLIAVEKHIDTKPLDLEKEIRYETITTKRAMIIGLSQSLALIPGVSRSGATIVSGLMSGINRPTATAFSFYLSVPLMLAASVLKLVTDFDEIQNISGGATSILVGMIVAFVTAFIVVKWLLSYVQRHDFKPFGYYRIVAGLAILLVLAV